MKSVVASAAAAALCVLAGCTIGSESTIRFSDAPKLPPRSGWVQVLRVEPSRPYETLGEIVLESSMNPAVDSDALEAKLRANGAALGGDAVIVTLDRTMAAKEGSTDAYATRAGDHDWKRRIVGVAIKYRE